MTTSAPKPPTPESPKRWHTGLNPLKHHVRNCVEVTFEDLQQARQRAGTLVLACLDDERLINFSLSYWPTLSQNRQDASLNVAYQMLWHFECDMGLEGQGPHKTDAFYADIQFELLKQAGQYLQAGQALPADLLMMYQCQEPAKKHRPAYYEPYIERCFGGLLTCWKRLKRLALR
jgi:hypothetical protein